MWSLLTATSPLDLNKSKGQSAWGSQALEGSTLVMSLPMAPGIKRAKRMCPLDPLLPFWTHCFPSGPRYITSKFLSLKDQVYFHIDVVTSLGPFSRPVGHATEEAQMEPRNITHWLCGWSLDKQAVFFTCKLQMSDEGLPPPSYTTSPETECS